MKKLFLLAISATMLFAGCSKITDALIDDQGDPWDNIPSGWTDKGNSATYKTSLTETKADDIYNVYWLFTFQFTNDVCTSAKWELGCPNAEIARLVYAEVEVEYKSMISVSGRIITVKMDEEFAGISKDVIKQAMSYWTY